MGHPDVKNSTPFAFQLLSLSDEDGRAIVVPVVKATFDVLDKGAALLAEEQRPVDLTGEFWGDPDTSAYKFEPEGAFCKPSTDVVLVGHAHAPKGKATQATVRFQVGALQKTLRVTGDRRWYQSGAGVVASAAQPFEKIPLSYDRAYGGWDRSDPDPEAHRFEPRNPCGIGYRKRGARFVEGAMLPNVEDPAHLLDAYTGSSVPAGVGFTSPSFHPRHTLGGTFDAAWAANRNPLLPKDFQRAFFNAASAGLVAPGYLRGGEPILAEGVDPTGPIRTQLPAFGPPRCCLHLRGAGAPWLELKLDTVILDSDRRQLILLWRALQIVAEGVQGVAAVDIVCEGAPAAKTKPPVPDNVIPFPRQQRSA